MDGLGTVNGLLTKHGVEAVHDTETVHGVISVKHLSNASMEKQTPAIVICSIEQGTHTHYGSKNQ